MKQKHNQQQKPQSGKKQSADTSSEISADSKQKPMDEPLENPAAQSEAGPDIYDIGMGGPGASSSGLRDTNNDDE